MTRSALLVVDEVHASDPYMERLLQALIETLTAAGGHVLLMSATLGSRARVRFLEGRRRPPPLGDAVAAPYPALWTGREPPVPVPPRPDRRVWMETDPVMEDAQAIARLAAEAAGQGGRVLVIRNTVAGAMAVQAALEGLPDVSGVLFRCGGPPGWPAPHHARFAVEDRRRLDDALERAFGRQGRGGAVVAVTTQTAEQSLDIDADLLITDLCPMDVLLQRLGRLHRHGERVRPAAFAEPRCRLLVPAERDLSPLLRRGRHGLGVVYPDLRVIEATLRLVETNPVFAIPSLNRALVEGATHPDVLEELLSQLGAGPAGEAWRDHRESLEGQQAGARAMAGANVIDRSKPLLPFPAIEADIRTRLGLDDRSLKGPEGWTGAFGAPVTRITLPGFLAAELPIDAEPVFVRDGETTLIRLADRVFRYDRWGLRPELS